MKGDNVPNFSKMNGGRTENGTAHGTSHGTQSCISYVNTGSGTPDGTSNVFQMVPTAPETETPFRMTTPSTSATTTEQALGMQNMQNTSWSGPPAHCARVHKLPK